MTYRVYLCNSAGILDHRITHSEAENRYAAIELLNETPYLCDGDRIVVEEIEEE